MNQVFTTFPLLFTYFPQPCELPRSFSTLNCSYFKPLHTYPLLSNPVVFQHVLYMYRLCAAGALMMSPYHVSLWPDGGQTGRIIWPHHILRGHLQPSAASFIFSLSLPPSLQLLILRYSSVSPELCLSLLSCHCSFYSNSFWMQFLQEFFLKYMFLPCNTCIF